MAPQRTIRINRAPVLTLWAAVVAERLGFDYDTSLTLGRAVAGLNAYSKGVSLGLFEPSCEAVDEHLQRAKAGTIVRVDLLHRAVPVMATPDGLRAVSKDQAISPASVEHYLGSKFGNNLGPAMRAMVKLAHSMPTGEIAARAYRLYEEFRPAIPAGVTGWGAAGELDLDLIEGLSERRQSTFGCGAASSILCNSRHAVRAIVQSPAAIVTTSDRAQRNLQDVTDAG